MREGASRPGFQHVLRLGERVITPSANVARHVIRFVELNPCQCVEARMSTNPNMNDNQALSREELIESNRKLKASLKRCETLVADCKDKLSDAYGLTRPDEEQEARRP